MYFIFHHGKNKICTSDLPTCRLSTASNKLGQMKSWVWNYCASAILDFTKWIQALMVCPNCFCLPYCPGKHPPPILTVLWFLRALRVTIHHAKFWCSEFEGRAHIASIVFDAFWVPWHQASEGLHTLVRGLVRSVLPLQHKIHVLQVTTERCRNLATRLWVGPLCSMI